jgi:MarR family transcriptional regulator for hemolysin
VASPTATNALDDLPLAQRLGMAGRLLRTLADAELAPLGLAAPSIAVLMRLREEDGLSQAALARLQRVEAPTMCRMVDRLVRDGMVERRADPADRRVMRVSLTPAGRETAGRGAGIVEGIAARAFAGLDADERRTLGELLGRVLERVPDEGGGG